MKINKINLLLLFVSAIFFGGCSDFDDTVVPSPAVEAGNAAVRFAADNETVYELDPSVSTEFTINLLRDDETAALEVPIVVVTNTENSYVVPSTVSFAAGSKTASLTISMSESAPKGVELDLAIKVDDSMANPYKTEYSAFYGKVTIPDWAPFATGTYYSWWYDASYAQTLEYSAVLDQYRFPNLISDGYHFIFTWDGGTNIAPIPETVESGYVHSTYGMVSATTNAATYDEATKTFTFTRKWTVDAGSFGEGDDTFTMD